MDYLNAPTSIITRNREDMEKGTGNIYQSLAIIGKRARQIAITEKEELTGKLAEFATQIDNLEEVFENREQIEISRYYEKMPRPTQVAIEEFLQDKIYSRPRIQEEN